MIMITIVTDLSNVKINTCTCTDVELKGYLPSLKNPQHRFKTSLQTKTNDFLLSIYVLTCMCKVYIFPSSTKCVIMYVCNYHIKRMVTTYYNLIIPLLRRCSTPLGNVKYMLEITTNNGTNNLSNNNCIMSHT